MKKPWLRAALSAWSLRLAMPFLLCSALDHSPALGQSSRPRATVDALARSTIKAKLLEFRDATELRARRVLDSQLNGTKYAVVVSTTFDFKRFYRDAARFGNRIELKTIPSEISNAEMQQQLAQRLDQTSLRRYLSNFEISVTVDLETTDTQIQLIKKAIASAADVSDSKVSIVKERLEAPNIIQKAAETSQKLERVTEEKSAFEIKSKIESQTLATEKGRIESELRQRQMEIEDYKRRLSEADKKISDYEEEISIYRTPLGDIKKQIKGLEVPMLVLPFAVVALVIAFASLTIVTYLSRKKSQRLFEGVELLSQAIGRAGGKGSSSSLGAAQLAELLQKSKDTPSQRDTASKSQMQSQTRSLPAQSFDAMAIRAECTEMWKHCLQHEFQAISVIKEWIHSDPESRQRAIHVLSALPGTASSQVLSKLGADELHKLRDEEQNGVDLLGGHAALSALQRIVSLASLSFTPEIVAFSEFAVIQASDRVYAQHLLGLKPELAAFGLSILPQSRFLRVSETMMQLRPDYPLEEVLGQLTTTQSNPDIAELFKSTMEPLVRSIREQSAPATAAIVKLFSESLKIAPGPLKAKIQAAIRRDPALSAAGLDGGVTIADLAQLPVEVVRELLDPYDTESLAKLLLSVEQRLIPTLVEGMSNKVRIATESEFNRMNSNELLRKRAGLAGIAIQEEILANLSQLVSEGVVVLKSKGTPSNTQGKAS